MPPIEHLVELRVAVKRAEARRERLGAASQFGDSEDLRTETICEVVEAIDRIDPGLGTRLLMALYPRADAQFAHAVADRRRAA
jgi:hypothetical protein